MEKQTARKLILIGACLLATLAPLIHAETYLYRYENEEGVKVINHAIPPEYTQKGYEILSSTGRLIKVVPPAPSDGEIAEEVAKRQLREQFEILKRRYGSTEDIEKAKGRRLENINTNISILRGNIGSIQLRIENLMSKAAEMERLGRPVSEDLLKEMADSRAELAVAEANLQARIDEYKAISERFERDLVTFREGSKLVGSETQSEKL